MSDEIVAGPAWRLTLLLYNVWVRRLILLHIKILLVFLLLFELFFLLGGFVIGTAIVAAADQGACVALEDLVWDGVGSRH